jgi:hypothetical protein
VADIPVLKTHPPCSLLLVGLTLGSAVAFAFGADSPAPSEAQKSIPVAQLGSEAQKQLGDKASSITPTAPGARLNAVLQDLVGEATTSGLWLTSVADEDAGKPNRFRVRAIQVGAASLPSQGTVQVSKDAALFVRPGLVEEYSVSADGVRQDFLVLTRPAGSEGKLHVALDITGARANATSYGAKLTVTATGREIAYSRLHVTDATGKKLDARMHVASTDRLRVVVEDSGAVYPVRIDPTFSDADWISMNSGLPGTNGSVHALAVDASGNLYVGGNFTIVTSVEATRIAKWDGSTWSSLSSGMDATVRALAFMGGKLYAGGDFSTAGGVTAKYIAQWDGTAWAQVGGGTNSPVRALLVHESAAQDIPPDYNGPVISTGMYVGGYFTTAGGVPVNCIARWDGTSWSALRTGVNGTVLALARSGPNLYVGGSFSRADGLSAGSIAMWNGGAWMPLRDYAIYSDGTNGTVNALAVSEGILYAAGSFNRAGITTANNVAQWNGASWSALGLGVTYTVNALAVSGSDLYMGGREHWAYQQVDVIQRWDGSSWTKIGTGANFAVNALAMLGDTLVAGGEPIVGDHNGGLARWDGAAWSPLGSGVSGSVTAIAMSGTDVYIGGNFRMGGVVQARNIAKWNGNEWSALGEGVNAPVTVLAAGGGDLYVGGAFSTAGGVPSSLIAKWDGAEWSSLGGGIPTGTVRSLAWDGANLYVGGSFTLTGNNQLPIRGVAKWNGSAWSGLGDGLPGEVYALAWDGTNLYAGNGFSTTVTITSPGGYILSSGATLSLNGTTYTGATAYSEGLPTLESSSGGTLSSVTAASSGAIIIGIPYPQPPIDPRPTIISVPAGSVMRWSGNSWTQLGTNMDGKVAALAVNGTSVYAGGAFSKAGGVPARSLAKWTGEAWEAIGSGVPVNGTLSYEVNALAMNGSDLYVCGTERSWSVTIYPFKGTPSAPIAKWDGSAWSTLGSTMDGVVRSLAVDERGFLLAGGDFIHAGTTLSPYFVAARIDGTHGMIVERDGVRLYDGEQGGTLHAPDGPGDPVTFTIRNNGGQEFTAPAVTLSGSDAGHFTLDASSLPASLPPGGSATFTVAFTPSATGARYASLQVTSGLERAHHFDVSIKGVPTAPNAALYSIQLNAGGVSPPFNTAITHYEVVVPHSTETVTLTAPPVGYAAIVRVNGQPVAPWQPSQPIPLNVGPNTITITVTSPDGSGVSTYTVTVTRRTFPGTLSIDLPPGTILDVPENVGSFLIPIIRTDGTEAEVGGYAIFGDRTAKRHLDYGYQNSGKFVLGNLQTSAAIRVFIQDNPYSAEPNETFTVTLGHVFGGATLGAVNSVTVRIVDSSDIRLPAAPIILWPAVGAVRDVATGGSIDVIGTATDNRGIKSVKVKLNDGAFVDAPFTTNAAGTTASYTLPVIPVAGRNIVTVQSFDTRGQASPPATRAFTVRRPLLVNVDSSIGTVTAGFARTSFRVVGKTYTITAMPKPVPLASGGSLFVGWTIGGGLSPADIGVSDANLSRNTIKFIFREGLQLTANFVAKNPYAKLAGTYTGLISHDTSAYQPSEELFGTISVTVGSLGGFSAKFTIDGVSHSCTGKFDVAGIARFTGIAPDASPKLRRTLTSWFELGLNIYLPREGESPDDAVITGGIICTSGSTYPVGQADILADKGHYNGTTRVVPAEYLDESNADGKFTGVFPSVSYNPDSMGRYPNGNGYTSVGISKAGIVTLAGVLADGATFTATSRLSKIDPYPGRYALFIPLYHNLGFLTGWVSLDDRAGDDMSGTLHWRRPTDLNATRYPMGWKNLWVYHRASRYNVTPGASVLTLRSGDPLPPEDADGNVKVSFNNGNFATWLEKFANVSPGDLVTSAPPGDASYTLTINRTTGIFTGSFQHTDGTSPSFSGIIMQDGLFNAGGYGFFLSTNHSLDGGVVLQGR